LNIKEYNKTIDLYADNIYRFALKHLKNEMDAKDVVQNTYLKVWEKHETIEVGKCKSYLFTTAYRLILDLYNHDKRHISDKVLGNYEEEVPFSNFNISDTLDWALSKLPEIQKTVVLLRDYEGYNYADIALITGISEVQVKVYIFRARKALKTILVDQNLLL
jgi:RNA polymerase sigma factor (sigma-70 family)